MLCQYSTRVVRIQHHADTITTRLHYQCSTGVIAVRYQLVTGLAPMCVCYDLKALLSYCTGTALVLHLCNTAEALVPHSYNAGTPLALHLWCTCATRALLELHWYWAGTVLVPCFTIHW